MTADPRMSLTLAHMKATVYAVCNKCRQQVTSAHRYKIVDGLLEHIDCTDPTRGVIDPTGQKFERPGFPTFKLDTSKGW